MRGQTLFLIPGMLIAIILGLAYNWKLGLVCAVFFPILIAATMLEMKFTLSVDSVEKQYFEDSAKLAVEAITNIRTVAGGLYFSVLDHLFRLIRIKAKPIV